MESWREIFSRRSVHLWPNRSQNMMFDSIELKQGKPPKSVRNRILSARQRLAAMPPENNVPPRDENSAPVDITPPDILGGEGAALEIENTQEEQETAVFSSANSANY